MEIEANSLRGVHYSQSHFHSGGGEDLSMHLQTCVGAKYKDEGALCISGHNFVIMLNDEIVYHSSSPHHTAEAYNQLDKECEARRELRRKGELDYPKARVGKTIREAMEKYLK